MGAKMTFITAQEAAEFLSAVSGEDWKVEDLLNEYYAASGWDRATGWPTQKKLEELGLRDMKY